MVCSLIILFFVASSTHRKGSNTLAFKNQGSVCDKPLRENPPFLWAILRKMYNGKGKNLFTRITLIVSYFPYNKIIQFLNTLLFCFCISVDDKVGIFRDLKRIVDACKIIYFIRVI